MASRCGCLSQHCPKLCPTFLRTRLHLLEPDSPASLNWTPCWAKRPAVLSESYKQCGKVEKILDWAHLDSHLQPAVVDLTDLGNMFFSVGLSSLLHKIEPGMIRDG